MGSPHPMIEADGLTKLYGSFVAVRDLSFRVNSGELVAFLGPNGAGKTTAMRMLTGFLSPTSGTARVGGLEVSAHRIEAAYHMGYLPEDGPLYQNMTPEGMLEFFGRIRGMPARKRRERRQRVIEMCGLGEVIGKKISKLSLGYRQRMGLANVLLHEPEVLILDEPTRGLDPNQTEDVRRTLRRIGQERTILLSTHILQEVEAVASRVLLIAEGRLVFDGDPEELKQQGGPEGLLGAFQSLTLQAAGPAQNQ